MEEERYRATALEGTDRSTTLARYASLSFLLSVRVAPAGPLAAATRIGKN